MMFFHGNITLADKPHPASTVDTDDDGLRDWDEIDTRGALWRAGLFRWNDNRGVTRLPTVRAVLNYLGLGGSIERFGSVGPFWYGGVPVDYSYVLPVLSNPMSKFTAGDGYSDYDKRNHGFNPMKKLEFTFTTENKTYQLEKGEKDAIFLGVHLVVFGNYHTSIAVFATPFSELYDLSVTHRQKFKEVGDGTNRLRVVTFGAGGDIGGLAGYLKSEFNRSKDKDMGIKVEMIRLQTADVSNTFYTMFGLDAHYSTIAYTVLYDAFVNGGAYNSNSYTHGLLIATEIKLNKTMGISTPKNKVPGWDKPLPKSYFGVS